MKISAKILFPLLVLALMAASCSNKTSSTNKKSSTSNGSTNNGNTTNTGDTADEDDCPGGIDRGNAIIECYYRNIPKIIFSGPGDVTNWSSLTNLANTPVPQDQFRTDSYLGIRMKPFKVTGGTSIQGRKCHSWPEATKVKIEVMIRRAEDSISMVRRELEASLDSYSNVARFKKANGELPGTNSPYIIEIIKVHTNWRCLSDAKLPVGSQNQAAYCPYHNFPVTIFANDPVKTQNTVTECVGVQLEVATDNSYDFK